VAQVDGPGPGTARPEGRLERRVPGLRTVREYRRSWLVSDVVAGLALTAVLIPVGMGYAQAAGLPPINGLYATVVPPLVAYAVFGPSRVMVLGPDSALAAVIAAVILPLGGADPATAVALAGALAVLTGLIIVAAGVARLGFVTELLSRPVQLGYLCGIAVTILAGQLPKLCGFLGGGPRAAHREQGLRPGSGRGAGEPGRPRRRAGRHRGDRRPSPHPATDPRGHGGRRRRYRRRGRLRPGGAGREGHRRGPEGPAQPQRPGRRPGRSGPLFSGALGIAMVAVADTTVLSQSLAAQRDETVDPDQELRALGAANLTAGLFQGFAISGSASRTPVAAAAGARSQLTPLVGAATIALLLLVAPGALRNLPLSMLAAIVITAAVGLIDLPAIRRLYQVRRSEFVLWLAAFGGVALLGVLLGSFVAILLSLGDFVRRAWRPYDVTPCWAARTRSRATTTSTAIPSARRIPGLLLYRFDAPLFFANAGYFRRRIRYLVSEATHPVRWVVVAAEPITDIDTTAADTLDQLLAELRQERVTLAFAEMKGPVKDRLRRYGLFEVIGADASSRPSAPPSTATSRPPASPGSTGRNAPTRRVPSPPPTPLARAPRGGPRPWPTAAAG
jgi:MFS superfamily sulfate permease-like transporter